MPGPDDPVPVPLSGEAPDALLAAGALALATGRSFEWRPSNVVSSVEFVDAGAVLAALGVVRTGDVFAPEGPPHAGRLEVTTGLPAALVAGFAAPALAFSSTRPELRLVAPTHPVEGPSVHDVSWSLGPRLASCGLAGDFFLVKAAPGGGAGVAECLVSAATGVRPIEARSRGVLSDVRVVGFVAGLGVGIASQLREAAEVALRPLGLGAPVEVRPLPSDGARGIALGVVLEFEAGPWSCVLSGVPGEGPEKLAERVAARVRSLLATRALFEPWAASVLLPVAGLAASAAGARGTVGGAGPSASRFSVREVTVGLLEVADVVRRMLGVRVQVVGLPGDEGVVDVGPA